LSLRARFGLWLGAVAVLGAVFLTTVAGRMRVETDLLAMLPQVDRDAVAESAARRLGDTGGRTALFLVGADAFAPARAAAQVFAEALQASGAFAQVRLQPDYDPAALDALYAPHRAGLLSDRQRAWLVAGEPRPLVREALSALYTPAGLLRARPFADDPLNLYGDFLAQQLPGGGRVRLRDGVLAVPAGDRDHVLVMAALDGSPFDAQVQDRAEPAIAGAIAAARAQVPGAAILSSGVIRHAAANATRAKGEISVFGSVSLLGVVLAVLLTFRSPRPLLLTLASLGVGVMAGLTACHYLFDPVHLMTLVFGSTLIGVAVDYSIHYFADQFRHAHAWAPEATLRHVGPAILIGMLSTAVGYQAFLLPPFPGLRQMAVFSVVGVAAACACVLLAYPVLANRRPAAHRPAILRLAARLGRWRAPRGRALATVLALLAALIAAGLVRLQFVDDIRALPASPPWLQQEEARVRELLRNASDTRFFLVEGADADAVLQAEEALRARLDGLVAAGTLGSYQAITRAVPSAARQRENQALLARHVYAVDGVLPQVLREAGYPEARIQAARAAFAAQPAPLALAPWLASPASVSLRPLWLGDTGRGHASAVTLGGVTDVAPLRAAAEGLPQVRFVDRVSAISGLMARYRRIAMACLAGAFAIIGGVLALRYGWRAGLPLLAAPAGGAALTLATLGLLGVDASLFNILALLLVLGMGVDYAVFMREGAGARTTVVMAILLAGLMTELSFGMLAFSATPFIRSIGLTVVLGVAYTFVLALLCAFPAPEHNSAAAESGVPGAPAQRR
jgi:predicted exporter